MICGAPRVKAAFGDIPKKSQLGQTTLWLILKQVSNDLYFTYVPSPSPFPNFIMAKLLRALHCPAQKNMDAPAWGNRFSFLWALNVNSELSSRKDRCKVHTCKHPGKQKGKLYIIIPYFPTTWTHGKLTYGNSALTTLSIYFCCLCTV